MTIALIPAAGKSTRMGRPKLTLPLGERTVLYHVLTAIRDAGVEHTVVVIGPHVPELGQIVVSAGAHALLLSEETPDMRATVEAGLAWLQANLQPDPEESWLLMPADHPALDPTVIGRLQQASAEHADCSIFVPRFEVNRGHPVLLAWKHAGQIGSLPAGAGINSYLRQLSQETFEVAVDSLSILLDLDTPEDYQRLQSWWTRHNRATCTDGVVSLS
jgi:molybdenum cofactor cytidylyltransferase